MMLGIYFMILLWRNLSEVCDTHEFINDGHLKNINSEKEILVSKYSSGDISFENRWNPKFDISNQSTRVIHESHKNYKMNKYNQILKYVAWRKSIKENLLRGRLWKDILVKLICWENLKIESN